MPYRITLALTILLGALAWPTVAGAADFQGPLAEWMTWEQHVSHIPGPTGTIQLRAERCPDTDAWGCADTDNGIIYLATPDRFAAYHELGHFYDTRDLTDQDRAELKSLMNVSQHTPWTRVRSLTDLCTGKTCPNEMFADAYANCALGQTPAGRHHPKGRITGGWKTAYGYSPTTLEQQAVCALIRRSAASTAAP